MKKNVDDLVNDVVKRQQSIIKSDVEYVLVRDKSTNSQAVFSTAAFTVFEDDKDFELVKKLGYVDI
jgi:hypothetical protein